MRILREIFFADETPFGEAVQGVEEGVTIVGLLVTLRGTMKQFPGCVHWHFRRGKERGTLEGTLLATMPLRFLLTVHENRDAPWILSAAQAISIQIPVAALSLEAAIPETD